MPNIPYNQPTNAPTIIPIIIPANTPTNNSLHNPINVTSNNPINAPSNISNEAQTQTENNETNQIQKKIDNNNHNILNTIKELAKQQKEFNESVKNDIVNINKTIINIQNSRKIDGVKQIHNVIKSNKLDIKSEHTNSDIDNCNTDIDNDNDNDSYNTKFVFNNFSETEHNVCAYILYVFW